MTEAQTEHHTPGPYQIEDVSEDITYPIYKVVKTGEGLRSVIASCADMALCDEHDGTVLANARLIAAAPELLAVLKDMLRSYAPDADLTAKREGEHMLVSCVRTARNLIAKAEGRD